MKIKKSELKNIIAEELNQVIDELAPCHNPKTGYFDDCEQGSDEYDEKYQILLAKFTERVLNEREKNKK